MFPEGFEREVLEASNKAKELGINNRAPAHLVPNLIRLAWFLDSLQQKLTRAGHGRLSITSGYRCKALNSSLSGASSTSAHLKGLAADLVCEGMTPYELACFIQDHMVEEGFDQVIHEYGLWVHVGLTDGPFPRLEAITAKKVGKKTKYISGIVRV